MGNPKTSTKVRPIVSEQAVRNSISNILNEGKMRKFCGIGESREVGFHKTWVREERPVYLASEMIARAGATTRAPPQK